MLFVVVFFFLMLKKSVLAKIFTKKKKKKPRTRAYCIIPLQNEINKTLYDLIEFFVVVTLFLFISALALSNIINCFSCCCIFFFLCLLVINFHGALLTALLCKKIFFFLFNQHQLRKTKNKKEIQVGTPIF